MPDAPSRRARNARARPAHAEPRRPHRGRSIAVAISASVAGLLLLSGAAYVVVPPVMTNLSARVAPGDTATATADGAVTVTVPRGWTVEHPFLQRDRLVLRTPDGRLTVTITATPLSVDAAFATLSSTAGLGNVMAETLGSGAPARHAQTSDGRTLVAAVGGTTDAARSATVEASVDSDRARSYQRAIAGVLESIRVAP